MLGNDYTDQNCSVARALEAVGERWTLLIVRELLLKPRRFSDLERRLPVSKNVLTTRLDKLLSHGIVETVPYDEARAWKTYRLTARGRDLFPIISALMAWGDAHAAPHGAPMIVKHACGHPAGHRIVCESCGEALHATNVHVVPGPGRQAEDLPEPDASVAGPGDASGS